ncbi:MAG: phosphoesterase, partial [Actinobacteria bacterium]|nr:phosphoesterase [Actinomycetota bacterium]
SLGNYIGMVLGQIPQPLDHGDCPTYTLCVRPGPTIAKQLGDAGDTWRGYFESMQAPCAHPTGLTDPNQSGYLTRHDPFVYFSEIVNDAPYCAAHVVPYESNFAASLQAGPASFSFIVPNSCNDGHDPGCAGNTSQVRNIDRWLSVNVPPILDYINTHARSALFITFDEAATTDTSSCCDQAPLVQGGGHVGFLMVGSADIQAPAGTRVTAPANHYSLLRTIEDGFGLAPLGEAGIPVLQAPMTGLFS